MTVWKLLCELQTGSVRMKIRTVFQFSEKNKDNRCVENGCVQGTDSY